MMDQTLLDRARGALLGLAVGDAVGTTLEFRSPGTFQPIDDMVGGGPFGLAAGEWTDDTSMMLCLAESLAECGRFDPVDQMNRYLRWWQEGYCSVKGRCFDIGNTVSAALRRFIANPQEPFAGSSDPCTAGNGSLMRLAPVPLFFWHNPVHAIEYGGQSSRTTHGAPAAVDACRYFAGLLIGALKGEEKAVLLSPRYAPVDGYWSRYRLDPDIVEVADGAFRRKAPPEIRGTGYVVESLEAALWAFATTDDFRSGCLAAANLGDDADTTAAIYGQLAGAYYGADGIPCEWRARLAWGDRIAHLADRLLTLSGELS